MCNDGGPVVLKMVTNGGLESKKLVQGVWIVRAIK